MKKMLLLLVPLFVTVFNGLCQEVPIPEGYKLKVSQNLVYAYRNVKDNPEMSVRKRWNNVYWFKVDNTFQGHYEDPTTKEKYIKITIPSMSRYDNAKKKWLSGPVAEDYNIILNWVNEQPIDGSDFNTWLWISEADFTKLKVDYAVLKLKSTFLLSVLTVPFKYRPAIEDQSNSVISGDLNLGSFIGFRLSNIFKWDFGMSIGGHFGISSIALNAANNSAMVGSNTETIQGFTYGGGIIFDIKKQFQLGIVLGQDYGIGNLAKTYNYQKRNWFSFSLNYNFLNSKKDKEDTNKDEAKNSDALKTSIANLSPLPRNPNNLI